MSYIVGLTGGIGSGKTVASDHFASLGVPIIDTDVIARQVVEPNTPVLNQLVHEFGEQILKKSGELDRAELRKIAFSDRQNKKRLDDITHPAIQTEAKQQISEITAPYCILVIPLLNPDSSFTVLLDRILVVTADREIKIARVMKRNQISRDQVIAIMQNQITDEERLDFSDDVIENNETLEHVHDEVGKLHKYYLNLSE